MTDDASRVCLGGPMMGPAASSLDIPITKGVSGIVVFTEKEVAAVPDVEYPCIRCSRCLEACPMFLNPSRLGALARNRQYEAMAEDHNLFDCFECGCCSYVCPSHIPLVQYFRLSKSLLRERKVA
jgi:electron transport complex protein RnfC